MAEIAFPTASPSNITLGISWPGQTLHRSIYTGEAQVITRGVGIWEGSVTFAERSVLTEEDQIREIEAFLTSLEGGANTFKVPVNKGQPIGLPDGTVVTASASTRAGSSMILTTDVQNGLKRGEYINIGDYLFILASSLVGGSMTVNPYRPLTIGSGLTVEWEAPALNARRTESEAIVAPYTPEFAGPWTIGFIGA